MAETSGAAGRTVVDATPASAVPVDSVARRDAALDAIARGAHPARVRLVLRVGVTGHRPNRLGDADPALLATRAREALEQIAAIGQEIAQAAGDAYLPGPPVLRLISSLAEGADRIVAREAMALGYTLQAPLPFDRDEFAGDFDDPASRAEYRGLLERAEAVLELDGSRDTPQAQETAYDVASQVMLSQSDILICVWDGEEGRGPGGTASVVSEAKRLAIPTFWIHARAPHETTLLLHARGAAGRAAGLDGLRAQLQRGFLPPSRQSAGPDADADEIDGAARYFSERYPGITALGWVWPMFVDIVGNLRLRAPRLRGAPKPAAASASWQADWAAGKSLPRDVTAQVDAAVEPHYLWADGLATYYVNLHRSSFVLISLLAVLAVFGALIGYVFHWYEHHSPLETVRGIGVAVVLALIMLLWWLGSRKRWHARGIDYRLLAEMLRQLRYLAPLGRVPASSRLPAHSASGDPHATWIGWHARAIARDLGLVSARITPEYLRSCRGLIRDGLIGGQRAYHQSASHRYERLEKHIKTLGMLTFGATLVSVGYTFIAHLRVLTMLEAVLPALGGAFGAIRSQGEIERLAKRSHDMHDYLGLLAAQIDELGERPSSAQLAHSAETATDAITTEVSDWHIVFQTRALELPG